MESPIWIWPHQFHMWTSAYAWWIRVGSTRHLPRFFTGFLWQAYYSWGMPHLGYPCGAVTSFNVDLSGCIPHVIRCPMNIPLSPTIIMIVSIYLSTYLSIYLCVCIYNVYICVLYTLRWPFWDGMLIIDGYSEYTMDYQHIDSPLR